LVSSSKKRFKFNQHITELTEKSKKLIHALYKLAKINWGLRSSVVKIIYEGAILPLLSYGIPVWIDALRSPKNANRLKQVQRLINIKIPKHSEQHRTRPSAYFLEQPRLTLNSQHAPNFTTSKEEDWNTIQ
jgi:hypothetical protein